MKYEVKVRNKLQLETDSLKQALEHFNDLCFKVGLVSVTLWKITGKTRELIAESV